MVKKKTTRKKKAKTKTKRPNQLKDIKPFTPITVKLNDKLKAVVGSLSLDTICVLQEKHGETIEEIVKKVMDGNMTIVADMLYALLENPEDFGDIRGFRKAVNYSNTKPLQEAMFKSLTASMVAASAAVADSTGGEEKN